MGVGDSLTLRYWQRIAERYLTALCHIHESAKTIEVEFPSPADLGTWVLTAPPMRGGEYLSSGVLQEIWRGLDDWIHQSIAEAGGISEFLQLRAAKWHQVGRVCFHLAENKNDESRTICVSGNLCDWFWSKRATETPSVA